MTASNRTMLSTKKNSLLNVYILGATVITITNLNVLKHWCLLYNKFCCAYEESRLVSMATGTQILPQ